MSKSELRSLTVFTTTINDDPFISPVSEWSALPQIEILYAEGRKYFYVFTDVTQKTTKKRDGNGKLHSVHTSVTAARQVVKDILLARRQAAEPKQARPSYQRQKTERATTKQKRIGPLE